MKLIKTLEKIWVKNMSFGILIAAFDICVAQYRMQQYFPNKWVN